MVLNNLALLAMTSKIMYDKEIIEMKKEIEKLKLKLFWKDHGIDKFTKIIIDANLYHPKSPKCDCYYCVACGRAPAHKSIENPRKCLFKDWFEEVLNDHEIKFISGYPKNDPEELTHISTNNNDMYVLAVDTHLINMGQLQWGTFTYGSKLYNAKNENNQEIQKLKKLFTYLTIE